MGVLVANNADSTLLSAITSAATVLFVQAADAAKFPQPVAAGDYFMLTMEDLTQVPPVREIVQCTMRSANQLTVVRAQENTTALNWAANVTASNRLTAAIITGLLAGTFAPQQLYLGTYTSAPTHTLSGTALVAGNLYYDSTLGGLYEYSGISWISVNAPVSGAGVYLGSASSAPTNGINGAALAAGDMYYATTLNALQVFEAGAWGAAVNGLIGNGNLQNFPDGAYFQWGIGTTGGNGNVVTIFPVAYHKLVSAFVCAYNIGTFVNIQGSSNIGISVTSGSLYNFQGVYSGPVTFSWLAIGY